MMAKIRSSPSHTYVAVCVHGDFSGYYLREFTLPEHDYQGLDNSTQQAAWFFLNVLNMVAMLELVMTKEEYNSLQLE